MTLDSKNDLPERTQASSPMVSIAVEDLPHVLTYAVPAQLSKLGLGDEVVVPLGKGRRRGWVVGLNASLEQIPNTRHKRNNAKAASTSSNAQIEIFTPAPQTPKVKEVLERHEAFLPEQVELFSWMSEYYGVPLAEVLTTALPKRHSTKEVLYLSLCSLETARTALEKLESRAPVQASILQQLLAQQTPIPLHELTGAAASLRTASKALEEKQLVQRSYLPVVFEGSTEHASYVQPPTSLTESQDRAVRKLQRAISQDTFAPHLLLGVTGSGKTEVYIRAIQHALSIGGTALLLVPEISLTPQLVDQLGTRLGIPLALLHSQVGSSNRWQYWDGLKSGKFKVAVGARSALFAPLPNLRLLIIDEEHESSYKQSDGFRYHGRDVAVMRAKTQNCTLILGSATPSLETLHNVQRKRYKLLELPERVHQREVPKIEIVDMLKIPSKQLPAPTISPDLHQALKKALDDGEQAVLLYNKRGFSSYLQCESCGEAVSCPHCSVALTYHKAKSILLCHYCNRQDPIPEACGYCRDPKTFRVEQAEEKKVALPGTLVHRGAGTERVFEDLQLLFPQARLARMDRDTVGAKDAYRTILHSMRSREADILVGTQMIAKGHDLPGVTLVGIIDADVGLHVPDFRTSERVYQLITQAAGRAGRGDQPGRVLVQTRQAHHPTILATATGRFLAFARFQLEQREKLRYPPHGRLLRIVVAAEQQREAIDVAEQLTQRIQALAEQENADVQVLGPAPAPHQRLRGLYRWHVLVKSNSARVLSKVAFASHYWRRVDFKKQRIAVDVDPVDML